MKIEITPVAKPRMTRSDKWKERPATTKYWGFKDELLRQVKGDLEPVFSVTFYIPMKKSWSNKKKQEMSGKPHQVKPDIDNYLKALMDCLCIDDSYIYDVRARKFWAEIGGIEIEDGF